jgi:hypothetical protein
MSKPRIRKWHGYMSQWTGYECRLLDTYGYGDTIESAYDEYRKAEEKREVLRLRHERPYILIHVPLENKRQTLLQRFIDLFI